MFCSESPIDSHPLTSGVCVCPASWPRGLLVGVWAMPVSRGMEGLFALEVSEALVTVGEGQEESNVCVFKSVCECVYDVKQRADFMKVKPGY